MRQPAVIDGQKRCATCKQWKPVAKFSRATKRKCGLQSACKACQQAAKVKWQAEHPKDYLRQQQRGYRRYAMRLRLTVLRHYGGDPPRCKRCGFDNILALTIDHINNDGAVHRRELHGHNHGGPQRRFYNWLRQQNYPGGFQVLCYNCQVIKYRQYLAQKITERYKELFDADAESFSDYIYGAAGLCPEDRGQAHETYSGSAKGVPRKDSSRKS